MSFDVSNNLELVGLDPSSIAPPGGNEGVTPVDTGFTSLGADSIQTSPLAFFGNYVQQIGAAMMKDPQAALSSDVGGSPDHVGMDDAIGLLENLVALMSAQGSGNGNGSFDTSATLPGQQVKASGQLD